MIDDPTKELADLLEEAGARVTFDRRRSHALPCWRCEKTDRPRDLVIVGTYVRPVGGNIQPGDAIMRPLCAECEEATRPVRAFKERRCRACGDGTIKLIAKSGRRYPFRGAWFEAPADFAVPTCDNCHEEWLDKEHAAALDRLLEQAALNVRSHE